MWHKEQNTQILNQLQKTHKRKIGDPTLTVKLIKFRLTEFSEDLPNEWMNHKRYVKDATATRFIADPKVQAEKGSWLQ